jgi:hypothetical protein
VAARRWTCLRSVLEDALKHRVQVARTTVGVRKLLVLS